MSEQAGCSFGRQWRSHNTEPHSIKRAKLTSAGYIVLALKHKSGQGKNVSGTLCWSQIKDCIFCTPVLLLFLKSENNGCYLDRYPASGYGNESPESFQQFVGRHGDLYFERERGRLHPTRCVHCVSEQTESATQSHVVVECPSFLCSLDFVLNPVFTALKRSLRRLRFYTCLSVILFTGGVSRPTSRGEVGGSGQVGLQAHTQWGLQAHTQWGLQAHTWGGGQGVGVFPGPGRWIPVCTEADTPQQTATAVGSTHPTGMHSRYYLKTL